MNQPDDTRAGLSHDRRRAGEQRGSVDALPRSSIARKTSGGNHPVVGREYARNSDAPQEAHQERPFVARKQANASRVPQHRPAQASAARPGYENRTVMRKSASRPPLVQGSRPQSSFTFIAPLLSRARTLPFKSGPLRPSFLVAEELRGKETKKEKGDYVLGPTKSAPRQSLPSMSVQRRINHSPRKATVPVAGRSPRKTVVFTRAEAMPSVTIHVGCGGKLVFGHSDDEDSSEDEDEDGRAHSRMLVAARKNVRNRLQTASKAARKTIVQAKAARKSALPSDRPDDEAESAKPVPGPSKMARKLPTAPVAEDNIELTDSEEEIDELWDAFDALTLGEARLKQHHGLPFLLRTLRRGFKKQCSLHGVELEPATAPKDPVEVVYRYYLDDRNSLTDDNDERECQQFIGCMPDWRCPMCELHQPFETQEVLNFHLLRDHPEVRFSWSEITTVRWERRLRIVLVIPDINEIEDSSSEDEDDEDTLSEDEKRLQQRLLQPQPHSPLFLPGSDTEESPTPVTPPPVLAIKEEEEKKVIIKSPVPRAGRPSVASVPRTSYRGSLDARYPSPPPPTDPLGPAAQPPYLPTKDADDKDVYSCRIGGPRIFDLLNTLPMEEFGLMSWAIIDREEELFEMDDVRDEDKVMLALWNRWIMLNRSQFVFGDYFQGVTNFLDTYWEMVHRAAGWRALRAFLIMLSVNKYLTFDKVLKCLQYYEEKTGMKMWYKDVE